LSDLAFDWCLARSWDEWSPEVGLLTFIENSLNGIQSCSDDLPGKASFALERMIQERWLQSYSELDLKGCGRRLFESRVGARLLRRF
jgi:acyl carrier protein phosphodiesterase